MVAILFIRSSPTLLAFGFVIGAFNYARTESFRKRTGVSPWHIHPVIWGAVSVVVSIFVTLLAWIAMSTTKAPVRRAGGHVGATSPGRQGFAPDGPQEGAAGPFASATATTAATAATVGAGDPGGPPPPGWHPDPSGRHEHRFWDGHEWTRHVTSGGARSIDPT